MEERIRFPHFKPIEHQIAEHFRTYGDIKGKWTFDVHLETPQSRRMRESGDPLQIAEAPLWDKRIDAVCETPQMIWIVEYDNRLRPSAIGKLNTYEFMYMRQYYPTKPIRKMVVAAQDDESMHDVLRSAHIEWRIVRIS